MRFLHYKKFACLKQWSSKLWNWVSIAFHVECIWEKYFCSYCYLQADTLFYCKWLFYYKKKKRKQKQNKTNCKIFTLKHLSFKQHVSLCNLAAIKILCFYQHPFQGKNREVHFIGSLLFYKRFFQQNVSILDLGY